MNKKITTLFILFLLLVIKPTNLFAEGQCSISNSPDYIILFIKNINKVNSNINQASSEKDSDGKKSSNIFEEYIGYINSIFSWTSYEMDFLYTKQETTQDIPSQIKRDIKKLKKLQKKIELKNPSNAKIKLKYDDICKGIDEKVCNFSKNEEYEAGKVIYLIKKSINTVIYKLQNKATKIDLKNKKEKIYLFPEENLKSLEKDYSKINLKTCSLTENNKGEKGFLGQVIDELKGLSSIKKQSINILKTWKEQISILFGNSEESKKQTEDKENIRNNLTQNGVLGNAGKAKIENTEKYNENSKNKTTGIDGFINSLISEGKEFEETLKRIFPEMEEKNRVFNKEVSTAKIRQEYEKVKQEQSILIPLRAEYKKLKDISLEEDIKNDTFINKLIEMHINLSQGLNTASKTCRISQKVCNDQLTGKGNCGQCY